MKITKEQLTQIIKEEINNSTEDRPRSGSAREDIEDSIQMLKSEDDVSGTLYYVIERLYSAIDKLQEGTNRMKITKSKLAQIIKEEIDAMKAEGYKAYKRDDDDKKPKRGLGESLARYGGLEDYVLSTLKSLGGERSVSDIALVAGEAWAADNWSDDDLIDKDDMFRSAKEALQNLQAARKVRLTQGGPDSSDEDLYAIA